MCGGIGSWMSTMREVSRREQAGYHGVHEQRLAPVRMLFPGNRRKLSRKGRVSHRMLGFTPGFFAQFDCTPESAHHMARCPTLSLADPCHGSRENEPPVSA
jgi:hypothetical protein